MCGIAGRLNFDGAPVDAAALEAAGEALAHRGPDGAGSWRDGAVGFTHRRLAIIDLSPRGAQPMHDAAGELTITFNGEIYNYRELRAELEPCGHRFASDSDTEVILAAYREWGAPCVQRFNGMFAFALWDGRTRTLLLARDRLGVKPLYFCRDGRRVAFASTVDALAAFPDVPRDIDPVAVGLYFQMLYVPAPYSIYRGIAKLQPGTVLEISANGTVREHAYWRLAAAGSETATDETAATARLETLLQSSVALRLISDVPLGAFLSGGIDSTLIVALMKQATPRVRTYTIGFSDREHDESVHARAIAAHLGTEHTEFELAPDDLLELADDMPRHYDEPFADASAIPTLALARLTRQHVTVALSGDGGDELLGGYTYYDYLARLDPLRRAAGPLRPLAAMAAALPLPHRLAMTARALGQSSTTALWAYMRGPLKHAAYGDLLRDVPVTAAEHFEDVLRDRVPDGDPLERYMDLDLTTYLADDILVKVDRATMAYGLEGRNPFLDYRVVEFARSLPLELRGHGASAKRIAKLLLARYVPAALTERPKQGFEVPIRAWLRGPLRAAVADTVLNGSLVSGGVLRAGGLETLLAEHASGRRNHESFLWAAFVFEKWRAQHA
jgi:asparagine synthase (glutamine-hydrolysing)